jgi:hypothetical protein
MQPTAATDPTLIGKQFGSAFIIDPIGTAAMAQRDFHNNQRNVIANRFPANVFSVNLANSFYSGAWQAWGNTMDSWPIRRVTFQQTDGWQWTETVADAYFRGSDDLATEFPDRDDRPASQNWDVVDVGNNKAPLARQWAGDYSWIVCVVPTTRAARDGMARNPESFDYDVTVVVFHKRPLPTGLPQTTTDMMTTAEGERPVHARIVSTGLTGGEVLLTALQDNVESPFENLKAGQWIMLCGPHPNSTTTPPQGEPLFVLNWYQVVSIDSERATGILNDPNNQRLVTLRGPEWPWQPDTNNNNSALSNNLCAGICRGAVAVHTKTLRAWGSGMPVVVPTDVAPPNVAL